MTPEAYMRIRRKWGSRLSRSGVIATQRHTMHGHPAENIHSRAIAGTSSSQYASIVTFPDIGRNPEPYEITHITTIAGPSIISSASTPAAGSTARGKFTDRTRFMFLFSECEPAMTERSKKRRSEEHTSELQSRFELVCRHLLEK